MLAVISFINRDLGGYITLGAQFTDLILDLSHHIHVLCSTYSKHLQGAGNLTVDKKNDIRIFILKNI